MFMYLKTGSLNYHMLRFEDSFTQASLSSFSHYSSEHCLILLKGNS